MNKSIIILMAVLIATSIAFMNYLGASTRIERDLRSVEMQRELANVLQKDIKEISEGKKVIAFADGSMLRFVPTKEVVDGKEKHVVVHSMRGGFTSEIGTVPSIILEEVDKVEIVGDKQYTPKGLFQLVIDYGRNEEVIYICE